MKLRLKHNTIRLRLTQSEVSRLSETGYVEEAIDFGPGADMRQLVYSVESNADIDAVKANFGNGNVRISVPAAVVKNWAETEVIGISEELDLSGGEPLSILIEKDFTCLTPREKDDEDTFQNPGKARECSQ